MELNTNNDFNDMFEESKDNTPTNTSILFFDIIKNCRLWPHLTNIAPTHIYHPIGLFNDEHNEKLNFLALL